MSTPVSPSTGPDAVYALSLDEAILVANALNYVLHGIDLPEFHTLMGATPEQGKRLQAALKAAIDGPARSG